MACFVVSAAEAVVVTVAEKAMAKKELATAETNHGLEEAKQSIPMRTKLKWLRAMLLGGAVLLMFEHIWHGEVVAWFPFLSAMANPADAAEMFREMATVGVAMALSITAVWAVICVVASAIYRRKEEAPQAVEAAEAPIA